MQEIQIFNNPEFGDIRTVMIDGEPWFVSKDISEKLGYTKTFSMTKQIDEEDKRIFDCTSQEDANFSSKARQIGIINESGLYSAIMGSKLKNAKSFKRWVTKEVLPSIRKTGGYGQPQLLENPMELLELHYEALKQVDKRVDEVQDKTDKLAERFDKFEKELPLMPNEADILREAVNKRVMSILGGKESKAYKNRSIVNTIFSDAYWNLKHNFKVRKYNCIKRSQIEIALKIAEEYVPPVYLVERIQNENTQQKMKL